MNYVVVGGSRGIGFGIVQKLAADGGNVTVLSRTNDQLGNLPHVQHIQHDVLQDEFPADQLPSSLNGLAYCVGSINLGPVRGLKPDQLVDDFKLNVVGAVKCIQGCLPALKAANTSSVVLFSTVAVSQGLPMHSSVSAAKGAVEGLTRSMAAELAPTIRINCIAPSLTDTPLAEKFLSSEQKRTAMAERHPLKRVGTVVDIANLAHFLLTERSSWMTGQVLGIDGGMSTLRT